LPLSERSLLKVFYASTACGVRRAVSDLLDSLGWERLVPPGEDILLKVNLTWDYLRPGVNTGPWVVEAVAERLRGRSRKIYLGESSQILVDADRALRVSGMAAVCERQGLVWHNFSKHQWSPVETHGLRFGIPEICTRMPVVSLPVVKTHYRTGISVALKNLYGCLNDGRHNYHSGLPRYLAAVNASIPVAFTLADGTVSLEGNGPKPGKPIRTDFVVASEDRVALDASVARVMGIDPGTLEILDAAEGVAGSSRGLEEECLPPLAMPPSFSFLPAGPNFVARVERVLRGRGRKREGDGPLINLTRFGARQWYKMAYVILGQKAEALRLVESLPYGPQWLGRAEEAPK
jgi:uncharacterized protein (DUF362 family)